MLRPERKTNPAHRPMRFEAGETIWYRGDQAGVVVFRKLEEGSYRVYLDGGRWLVFATDEVLSPRL